LRLYFWVGQAVSPVNVRELAKGGSAAIPQLQALLKNPDLDIRIEAVHLLAASLKNPALQKMSLSCTHMLRMPLSVNSRFIKRPGGEPATILSGI
jgi:hypothetical protein